MYILNRIQQCYHVLRLRSQTTRIFGTACTQIRPVPPENLNHQIFEHLPMQPGFGETVNGIVGELVVEDRVKIQVSPEQS